MEILRQQYKLVLSAREALFTYISTIPFQKLHQPVEAFNNKSVCYLLSHIARTYISWLDEFAFKNPLPVTDETAWRTMNDVKTFFLEADDAVYNFLSSFDDEQTILNGLKARQNIMLSVSVLELFTHTVSHEFYHKGQVVTMTRLLGYMPVDTDVIRF